MVTGVIGQCFCYVCDVKASECRYWGTGARDRDHANARHLGYWRQLREVARAGNRSLVHAEYHKSGPLVLQSSGPRQAQLHFPQAAHGLKIADLAPRVPRFGFYHTATGRKEDSGEQMPLERLMETKYGTYKGTYKRKAAFLKLLPLPAPPEEAVPVPTERVRKVLVIDCLGRTKATYLGVRMDAKAKRADLVAALAPMLRPAFSAASELLHVAMACSLKNTSMYIVSEDRSLDDDFFATYSCSSPDTSHIIVFRTTHHPSPTWESKDSGCDVTQMPVYSHTASIVVSPFGTSMKPAAWVVVFPRQMKPPSGPDTPEAERHGLNHSRLSVPILVPLAKDHVKGGRDAEKALDAALIRAMQPYRTTGALSASAAAPAVVLRDFVHTLPENPDQLRVAYRMDDLLTLAVDASALPEALAQTEAHVKEAKRRMGSLHVRKSLPESCVSELIKAARRPHPEDKAAVANMSSQYGGCECLVALDMHLKPSSRKGASEREGELVIKVYAWTTRLPFRDTVFRPWDDWPSLGKKESSSFPLTSTMELLATGATDPIEQQITSAASATAGGPSTSSGPGSILLARQTPLLRRMHAERQRAREMLGRVKALKDSGALDTCRSINSLLEFMQSGERPAVPQPPGLTVTMRPYQLQSLAFMLEMERLVDSPAGAGSGGGEGPSTSRAAAVDPADPDAPDGGNPGGYRRLFWVPITAPGTAQRYWYSPVLRRLSREVPPQPTGGFLAEEMGLGKTVEVMALTLANPPPPSVVVGSTAPCGRIVSGATLVVCAVSLVGQWQAEAQNKTTGACRIHPYHGPSRIRDPTRLATEFDVVVTTYQTLQSDHASGKDPCQSILWHRIVFDEGHTLKSSSAKLYKTAVELASQRKWLCTGTPLSNAVDDLLGQFGAIHMLPLGKKTYFDSYIKAPFNGGRYYQLTPLPLLYALRHAMIRHTKAQNLGGEGVLQLPPKAETDVPVLLTEEEKALYRRAHKEAARGWQKLKAMGTAYVNSHLFTATSMLLPLRRICSGGLLQPKDLTVPDPERLAAVAMGPGGSAGAAAAGGGGDVPVPEDVTECPICVDNMEEPVVTPCNHWFCRECITGWINASVHHNCPSCRNPITVAGLRRGMTGTPEAAVTAEGDEELDAVACESKLRVLLAELRAMRETDPEAKALVFTQFGQTLEWLKPRLAEEGFGHRSITGDMTQKKRTEAIASFQRDPGTSVFLLSLRSGAVGINLTAANYIFLLEPCINPAMEEQAIGRAWRMGQQRPVFVKRLYVKGSIEERIVEIVKARRAASGGDAPATPSAVASGSRAGAAGAVAGALRQDKTDLRINELDLMFGEPQFPAADTA
ncbi:hypothetical protein GPECTOR_7g958 [Gonium pectorale]|uniref:RING-type domain-containing protein n=1 Tax=Gonium pectorale TaxID=33097 RepID=A0A150GUY8_GONPE|nr:hypothetical protein GPECTOR_7g958 [Gonium pectorale]|eukprot:KXZ53508.1 hypothetical protein GPECTOR_7g958 [Gonium pectorale]